MSWLILGLLAIFLVLGMKKKREMQSDDTKEVQGTIIGYEKHRRLRSAKSPFQSFITIYRVIINGEEIVFRDLYGIKTRDTTRIGEQEVLYYNTRTQKIFSKGSVDSYFKAPLLVLMILLLATVIPLIKMLFYLWL